MAKPDYEIIANRDGAEENSLLVRIGAAWNAIDKNGRRYISGTRWCPFSRVQQNGAGINRVDLDVYPIPIACRCLASACMAWRWLNAIQGTCGLAGLPGSTITRDA